MSEHFSRKKLKSDATHILDKRRRLPVHHEETSRSISPQKKKNENDSSIKSPHQTRGSPHAKSRTISITGRNFSNFMRTRRSLSPELSREGPSSLSQSYTRQQRQKQPVPSLKIPSNQRTKSEGVSSKNVRDGAFASSLASCRSPTIPSSPWYPRSPHTAPINANGLSSPLHGMAIKNFEDDMDVLPPNMAGSAESHNIPRQCTIKKRPPFREPFLNGNNSDTHTTSNTTPDTTTTNTASLNQNGFLNTTKNMSPTAEFLYMMSQKSEAKSARNSPQQTSSSTTTSPPSRTSNICKIEEELIEIETGVKKFVVGDNFGNDFETYPSISRNDLEGLKSYNRQNLIVFLLQRVCAFVDNTPKTFILNCLKMYECGILTNLEFLSQPSQSAQNSGLNFDQELDFLSSRQGDKQNRQSNGFSEPPPRINIPRVADEHILQDFQIFHFDDVSGEPRSDFSLSRYKKDFVSLERIGRGAFGQVFRARHKLDGVEYAIKQIKFSNVGFTPLIRRKVLREVKNLARLDHPNICRYYNAWIEPIWDEATTSSKQANVVEISNSMGGSSGTGTFSGDFNQQPPKLSHFPINNKFDELDHESSVSHHDDEELSDSLAGDAKIEALIPYTNYFDPFHTILGGGGVDAGGLLGGGEAGGLNMSSSEGDGDDHFFTAVPPPVTTAGAPHSCSSIPDVFHLESDDEDEADDDISFDYNKRITPKHSDFNGFNVEEVESYPHKPLSTPNSEYSSHSQIHSSGSAAGENTNNKSALMPSPNFTKRRFDSTTSNEVRSIVNLAESLKYNVMLYIQTQLCGPDSLKTLLSSNRSIEEETFMNIFHQILCGLDHIHKRGIVHRDLKPDNIFLWEDPLLSNTTNKNGLLSKYSAIKIGDFGLSRDITAATVKNFSETNIDISVETETENSDESVNNNNYSSSLSSNNSENGTKTIPNRKKGDSTTEDDSSMDRVTRPLVPICDNHTRGVGTRTYASPEQVQGREITAASDIYSLGIILFEMFNNFSTGMERARAITDVRKQKVDQKFIEAWPEQARLVQKMTSLSPRSRPSAAELLVDPIVRKVVEHYHSSSTPLPISTTPMSSQTAALSDFALSPLSDDDGGLGHQNHYSPPPILSSTGSTLRFGHVSRGKTRDFGRYNSSARCRSLSPSRLGHQAHTSRQNNSHARAKSSMIDSLSKHELVSRVVQQEDIITAQKEEIDRLLHALASQTKSNDSQPENTTARKLKNGEKC